MYQEQNEVVNIEVNVFGDFQGREIEDYYENDPQYHDFDDDLSDHAYSIGYYLSMLGCDYNTEDNMASLVEYMKRIGEIYTYFQVNVNFTSHQSDEDRVDIVADGKKMESFKDTTAYVTNRLDSFKKEVRRAVKNEKIHTISIEEENFKPEFRL